MNFTPVIAGLLAIITLSTSCTGVKDISDQSATQLNAYTEGQLSYKSQHRFKFLFLEAQRLKALEEFEKAANMIAQCLAIDPLNAVAHYEIAQLHVRNENLQDALFHAKQSLFLDPVNVWTLELLSQLYYANGNREGQISVCKNLTELKPTKVEYQYRLASAYADQEEYKKALDTYNKIEKKVGISEDLSIVKEHIYIEIGDIDRAASELKALIAAFPDEIRFQQMLADLYYANDFKEKSLAIYKDILVKNPKDSYANSALAEYFRLKNDYLKAFEYLNICFDDPDFNLDVMLQVLSSYFDLALKNESYEASLRSLINKALLNHPNQSVFHILAGDFHFQKDEPAQAFMAYEKALNLGANEYLIWNRYLILGLDLKEYEKTALKSLKSIEAHPVQASLYLFAGFAHAMSDQKKKAIELWNKGLNYVVNNPQLKAEFYNYLGDAYNAIEEYDLSDESYENSLSINPNNPMVLNNYSYYLSLRSKDLEKAQKLSKKCIDLAPDQPTYEDTYGWILYKLERYVEAEVWLKKAVMGEGDSSVILEHYGDVLYQVNRPKEALEYWIKAEQAGGESDNLKQKIQDETLYE